IERAQELMYHLSRLAAADRIPELPVYLDSPMAVNVTEVFRRYHDFLNEEIWEMLESGDRPFRFEGLKLVRSVEESKKINKLKRPAVIMAGSGMCTGGRIKHHLRNNLVRSQSTVLFVGYQSVGTLGRQILEGADEVRIHGRKWPVRAGVAQIQGLSAHADRSGLLKWLGSIKQAPRQIFLTHGEENAAKELAAEIKREMDWPVTVPKYRQSVELD
ncbi:MAG: MBL fold metallo-hydrolase, partial [Phycisphaerae bacterium]|nr:MBL fold metallo-hydrolase [Phycisphaerae bacterium]